ncbi:MAG: gamma-glutamyltransferase [Gemmatimonadetes bacterium]|jgi:gamma-glutamyltranspeptidase / glutathione hydrolase|nr:gamma-glutamyltransferase [Gemmatimonadota bacterium]
MCRRVVLGVVAFLLAAAAGHAETRTAGSGMVVSEHRLASQAGRDVLAAGGNAVDAAIATGFALAVTHPSAGNIGGGGFMVIRFADGTATAIDFREVAPLAAHPEMWLDDSGAYTHQTHHNSHQAVGVPGTVSGFDKAHRLYGTAAWEQLLEPAIHLAAAGFALSERLAHSLARFVDRHAQYEATVAQFSRGGLPLAPGDTLRQSDLGASLRRIRADRSDGFYAGETARLIVAEMQRGDGLITATDLTRYQARERTPIHGTYRGYDILGMPPPSSGGVAIATMLNILEAYDLRSLGHNSPGYIHLLTEAMRRAFRDRATWLADADVVDVPIHRLTNKKHADWLRRDLLPRQASVSAPTDVITAAEGTETTHFSVVDAQGMAVAVTYTLEGGYGSGIVVPGAGFLLNNEMGDFNAAPGLTDERGLIGTTPNLARPGQRMLSSMSPSILSKDGRLVAVLGSPGGRTIINTVLQLVLNLVDFDMSIDAAVAAPRIHHQWLPDVLRLEAILADDDLAGALAGMGHTVKVRGTQGLAHSIGIDALTGERIGAADPRNPDASASGH